jgi:hypothetical protein
LGQGAKSNGILIFASHFDSTFVSLLVHCLVRLESCCVDVGRTVDAVLKRGFFTRVQGLELRSHRGMKNT